MEDVVDSFAGMPAKMASQLKAIVKKAQIMAKSNGKKDSVSWEIRVQYKDLANEWREAKIGTIVSDVAGPSGRGGK